MYAKENFLKISRMAAMVTVTASLLLVSTVPSFGADEQPPNCLEAEPIGKKIEVRNKCGRGMRFKIAYAFAPDDMCRTIGKAYTKQYNKKRGRFDGLRNC